MDGMSLYKVLAEPILGSSSVCLQISGRDTRL